MLDESIEGDIYARCHMQGRGQPNSNTCQAAIGTGLNEEVDKVMDRLGIRTEGEVLAQEYTRSFR